MSSLSAIFYAAILSGHIAEHRIMAHPTKPLALECRAYADGVIPAGVNALAFIECVTNAEEAGYKILRKQ